MHEISIASSLIQQATGHVPEGQRLLAVRVTVGPLSGICAESLEFCFSAVSGDLGYGSVKLIITRVPACFECLACGGRYESESVYTECPLCHSLERITHSGDRFSLDAIDVEDNDHV